MGRSRSTSRRPAWVAAAIAATLAASLVPLAAAPASAATQSGASASAFAAPTVVSAADAKPEHVVLTPTEHADVSQSFTWRTGAEVSGGAVNLRTVGETTWRTVEARLNDELLGNGVATRTHSATIDGLTAGTDYEYYVGTGAADGASASKIYGFTTAGAAGDPFQFIYFGDAQNNLKEKWAPIVKQAFERFPDAVGTVNAGDLVNTGDDQEWGDWFGAMDGYSQTRNVIAAPGNHEYKADAFLTVWKSTFEYAANGPKASIATQPTDGMTDRQKQVAAYEAQMEKALNETAYYTDYQGVRFITLNATRSEAVTLMTPDDLPPCLIACPNPTELWVDMQARWLDSILVNNPNKWAVAVFHQPVFSTGEGRDETDLREAWLPVFQRNDIDLVLMGHDHTYGRGFVNADATATQGVTTGPVYAVAVSGPKYYEMQPEDSNVWTQNGATMVARAGHTSTFQGITVSENQIRYESVIGAKWDSESTTDKAVGDILDAFTITKYNNGEKYVTEDGIPIPEQSEPTAPAVPAVPAVPEEPAGTPSEVPLGHEIVEDLTAPTATTPGPTTVNTSTGVIYTADKVTGLVEAIDPDSGEVLDSFSVGTGIQDISYVSALNAIVMALDGNKIAAYLTNPATFGAEYLKPTTAPAAVKSIQVDQQRVQILVGLANGTLITFDEGFNVLGQASIGGTFQGMRLDSVTGVLYVSYANEADGEVGLRLFETRNAMHVLKEFPLDRAAGPLDIDMQKGIAYVGHHASGEIAGGLSVVDLLNDTVTRYNTPEFGNDITGVGVNARKGLVYLANSTRRPAPLVVVGRQQAPAVTSSPEAQVVDAGDTVTLNAGGRAVPAPSIRWESRAAGSAEWIAVATPLARAEGASNTLEVVASNGLHGTQYRAVFTNTIGEASYSTVSATATLRIAALITDDTEPGDGPGTEPGTEPGDGPVDVPATPGVALPGTGSTVDGAVKPAAALAATGSDAGSAALAALLLLIAGAATVLLRRRGRAA